MRMIKALGASAAAGTSMTNGSNVDKGTCVRAVNNTTTNHLVTVETAGNVIIGSFQLAGGSDIYVEKDPTDEIFAANAGVLLTKVALR